MEYKTLAWRERRLSSVTYIASMSFLLSSTLYSSCKPCRSFSANFTALSLYLIGSRISSSEYPSAWANLLAMSSCDSNFCESVDTLKNIIALPI